MTTFFRRTSFAAIVGGASFVTSTALAQARLGAFASAGFGGRAEGSVDLESGVDPEDSDPELKTSLGVGASYDIPVAKVLSLGGLVRLASWEAYRYTWEVDGDNAGVAFDLAFLPRLHFAVRQLKLYAAVPVGLTMATKEDNFTFLVIDSEYDMGWGYNLGLVGGVEFPVKPDLALFGELGYLGRGITQQAHAEGDSSADAQLHYSTGQFMLSFGVAFY